MDLAIHADTVPHADPAAMAAKGFAKDAASNESLHRLSISHGTLEPYANIDDAILRANGHDQVLKRQFSWVSALGLSFSITNSWIGYLVRPFSLWLSQKCEASYFALTVSVEEQFRSESRLWWAAIVYIWAPRRLCRSACHDSWSG